MRAKATTENGFKETEIGMIPKDWDVKKLSDEDVAHLIMGQSPPSSTYNAEGKGFPFLQGKADFGRVYPTPTQWCTHPSRIAEKNDVLMSVRAPVGDVNIAPYKCAIGRGLAAIRPKQTVSSRFLFQYLTFAKEIIESHGTGSIFKSINKSILQNFQIAVPDSYEQQNIAFVLTKIQQAIEQQEQIIITTKDLKKSLMKKLFTESLHGEEQKETEIGLMPKSWEIATVDTLFECHDGKRIPVRKTDRVSGLYPYYGASGITDYVEGYIFEGDFLLVAEDGENLESRKLPIAFIATGKFWVNNHAHILKIRNGSLKFYEQYIAQMDIRDYLSGTTRPKLTKGLLMGIRVPKPPVSEQEEIALIFRNIDKKLSQTESRKATLQHLFRTMLNQLMTGRVRVKDLDIQVN